MKTTRTLRVGAMYRPATHSAVPHLRLTGDWLRAAGFPAGAPVDVAIADGTLTIRQRAAALNSRGRRHFQKG